jgi:hypothetical protein
LVFGALAPHLLGESTVEFFLRLQYLDFQIDQICRCDIQLSSTTFILYELRPRLLRFPFLKSYASFGILLQRFVVVGGASSEVVVVPWLCFFGFFFATEPKFVKHQTNF